MDDATTLLNSVWDGHEDVIRRFEDAWRGQSRPEINAYLPTGAGRTRLLTELVHVDLENRLRAGEPARVEDYLTLYPELEDDRATAVDLIAAEFELRRRYEPDLSTAEYLQRFPQYAPELADKLAAAGLEGGPGRDRSASSDLSASGRPSRRSRVRGPRPARPRRHGGGVQGPAAQPRPPRRPEVPARGVCPGPGMAGALPARGPHRQRP